MKSKSSNTNRTHIVKRDSGWALKKEGSQRASKVFSTKEAAIKNGQVLKNSGSDLIIHRKDGSIQTWEKSK